MRSARRCRRPRLATWKRVIAGLNLTVYTQRDQSPSERILFEERALEPLRRMNRRRCKKLADADGKEVRMVFWMSSFMAATIALRLVTASLPNGKQ